MTTAFVLGGGGVRGAVVIGMVGARVEARLPPPLGVGPSGGALKRALQRPWQPTPGLQRLEQPTPGRRWDA